MSKEYLNIEDARIIFRNFSGVEGKFNPAGERSFCVYLEPELAEDLFREGWNVRGMEPRNPDEDPQPYLQVKVSYKNQPPKIITVTNTRKVVLDENTVSMLDWADIEAVDLSISPYAWEVQGKSGIKGYAKTMYVTIKEDPFEKKYSDIPDGPEYLND